MNGNVRAIGSDGASIGTGIADGDGRSTIGSLVIGGGNSTAIGSGAAGSGTGYAAAVNWVDSAPLVLSGYGLVWLS
jgi:hypothetical protein